MIWLTWRQFRVQALTLLTPLAALAVALIWTEPGLAHLYAAKGLNRCAVPGDCGQRTAAFLAAVHEARPRRLLTKKNVFTGRQSRNEVEFLVDDGDSGTLRIVRRMERAVATVYCDRARVGTMSATAGARRRSLVSNIF